jgi:hypothetical protein
LPCNRPTDSSHENPQNKYGERDNELPVLSALLRNSDDGNIKLTMTQCWDHDKEQMEGSLQNALGHCHYLQYQSHMNSPILRDQKPAHNRLSPDAVQSIYVYDNIKINLNKIMSPPQGLPPHLGEEVFEHQRPGELDDGSVSSW